MAKKAVIKNSVALMGLIIVLAVSFGIDRWILVMRTENSRTFSLLGAVLWSYVIGDLIWAGLLLLLFWFMVSRGPRNWFIACIYLLVGLIQTLFPVLYISPIGQFWRFLAPFLATGSTLMRLTGGFITIIGGCTLALSLRQTREEAGQEAA
jgi:hypothetical protein